MSGELFREVSDPTVRVTSSSRYTLVLSILVHTALALAVFIVPLMATGALPALPSDAIEFMAATPIPPSAPAPPAPTTSAAPAAATPPSVPIEAPDGIRDEEPHPAAFTGDVAIGGIEPCDGCVPGGLTGNLPTAGLMPPPPPPAATPPARPVRPGGLIREPRKIVHVGPVYPPIAHSARIQGTVVLDATIGTDGIVRNVRVLRSVPLLDQAAIDAVKQWRYAPTLLNDQPVAVVMTVQVRFILSQ